MNMGDSVNDQSLKQQGILRSIYARRSVRAYAPTPVDDAVLPTLLDAAVHAPTAMHEEPWAFVIVQDARLLQRLSDIAKPAFIEEVSRRGAHGNIRSLEHFSRADFNIFHGAGTLIIICARQQGPFAVADCWLAAENLMLAADAIGLGTCVIGSAVSALNAHKKELGMPDEYSAIAPIVVGVPGGETRATSRNKPVILSWKK